MSVYLLTVVPTVKVYSSGDRLTGLESVKLHPGRNVNKK